MPVERFEPSTLAGLVFETSAYTVPPHRLIIRDALCISSGAYNSASQSRSQEVRPGLVKFLWSFLAQNVQCF